MGITYKKLYKMLIDRDMMKKDLAGGCGLSVATMAKLGKGRNVNTDVLVRVCNFLRCDISDICEVILDPDDQNEKQPDSRAGMTASRRLTQQEFDEITMLSRKCIDAYSSKSVADEIRCLKFMANTLDVDPYIKGIMLELANYSQEASKQKPHNVKDHWVNMALSALEKLNPNGTDRKENP